tara:strand:+ start:885 stop:2063 length:1179 start_codon:yes stop_codon:yes gene_type:complete
MAVTINGTTGISSVDGSSASPSLRGTDSNSGIVYGADTVKISTGGTERLEVDSSGNIDIPDNGKIRLGTGNDLSLYHTGSVSHIEDNVTNVMRISSDSIALQSGDKSEAGLVYTKDGSVDLYYNNHKACFTNDQGITVLGKENEHGVIYLAADESDDNADWWAMVASKDASNWNLQNFNDGAWEDSIRCWGGSATYGVAFYQNNSHRCSVIGNGFQIEAGNALYIPTGSWTGDAGGKIQGHNNSIYFQNNGGGWYFRDEAGNHAAEINSSGTYSSSDQRLKKDIATIPNAVDTIKQLTGRSFTWINGDKKSFGIIAQEVQSVLPDIITTSYDPANKYPDDPMRSVNYAALTGHFIEAIKELSAEVETLKTEKTKLQTDLTALTARVAALEAA